MNIKIHKITQSQKKKNVCFIDVDFGCPAVRLKGVVFKVKEKGGVSILLPHLRTQDDRPYSPLIFVDKADRDLFISAVKESVSKMLNIGV